MKKALPAAVRAGVCTAAIEVAKIGSGGGTKLTDPWCTRAGSRIVRMAAPLPGGPPVPPRTAMNLATGAAVGDGGGLGVGVGVGALVCVAQGSTVLQSVDVTAGAGAPQPARSATRPAIEIASEPRDQQDVKMRLPEC
jgi:hypothetical protein